MIVVGYLRQMHTTHRDHEPGGREPWLAAREVPATGRVIARPAKIPAASSPP
jgi:hypothetical protein